MKEQSIQDLIRLGTAKLATLFRINVGMGWTGSNCKKQMNRSLPFYGCMIIHNPRPFRAGPPEGYADLTGWTKVKITEDMVGQTIAVFTAVEVKSRIGKAKDKQLNFIEQVKKAGGKAGIARSVENATRIINGSD